MRLIQPSTEIIIQQPDIDNMYKHIELCGRTCYKSEDKITEDSAHKFVNMIINSGHGSVLEQGTVYLKIPYDNIMEYVDTQNPYDRDILCNPWTRYVIDYGNSIVYITSNYRWIIENNLQNWMQYICDPTEHHENRISVKFICSRAISHELVRHRVFSFSQESQRYCAYNKDKFNNEVTFIMPEWYDQPEDVDSANYPDYGYNLLYAESRYLDLLEQGLKAQEAREVLPNSTKTEIIMTGFVSDWEYFFKLRCNKSAHPEMRKLTIPLKEEFKERGLING